MSIAIDGEIKEVELFGLKFQAAATGPGIRLTNTRPTGDKAAYNKYLALTADLRGLEAAAADPNAGDDEKAAFGELAANRRAAIAQIEGLALEPLGHKTLTISVPTNSLTRVTYGGVTHIITYGKPTRKYRVNLSEEFRPAPSDAAPDQYRGLCIGSHTLTPAGWVPSGADLYARDFAFVGGKLFHVYHTGAKGHTICDGVRSPDTFLRVFDMVQCGAHIYASGIDCESSYSKAYLTIKRYDEPEWLPVPLPPEVSGLDPLDVPTISLARMGSALVACIECMPGMSRQPADLWIYDDDQWRRLAQLPLTRLTVASMRDSLIVIGWQGGPPTVQRVRSDGSVELMTQRGKPPFSGNGDDMWRPCSLGWGNVILFACQHLAGPEGIWAYDTVTGMWSKLETPHPPIRGLMKAPGVFEVTLADLTGLHIRSRTWDGAQWMNAAPHEYDTNADSSPTTRYMEILGPPPSAAPHTIIMVRNVAYAKNNLDGGMWFNTEVDGRWYPMDAPRTGPHQSVGWRGRCAVYAFDDGEVWVLDVATSKWWQMPRLDDGQVPEAKAD
jgi:hypothetical protein